MGCPTSDYHHSVDSTEEIVLAAISKYREHIEQHGPRDSKWTGCYCRLCNAVHNYLKSKETKLRA